MNPIQTAVIPAVRLVAIALAVLVAAGVSPARADDAGDVLQLLRAGKRAEALTRLDTILVTKPRDPQLRFMKGVILSDTGRTGDAIATFAALTQEYPELPEPHNNLAVLYAGQGQYDLARASLEMAVRNNPGYAVAHENLGDIHVRLAAQAYARAQQLDSANTGLAPKLALMRTLLAAAAERNATPPALPPAPLPIPVAPPGSAR